MRISEADIIIVPGLSGGTDDHWYSRWEAKIPTARRVVQADWHRPTLAAWTDALVAAVGEPTKPVVLVAHSAGCITIAHAAPRLAGKVAGAFLVAPPSRTILAEIEQVEPAFADVPHVRLPFRSVVVASRDDAYCAFEDGETLAAAWGANFVDAGLSGHLNDESGHGPWPEGLMRFAGFLKTL